ncbi:MAG TPA: hypothetical protein VIK91_08270 [Nannocystis sp.]
MTVVDRSVEDPIWLSWADVDAWHAWQAQLGKPTQPFAPERVLEANDQFAGAFARITPDEARRPITFLDAQAGVDWDTTGIAPGAYVVRGYTWRRAPQPPARASRPPRPEVARAAAPAVRPRSRGSCSSSPSRAGAESIDVRLLRVR